MTLSELLNELSEEYGVTKRPLRYFDVEKRGDLSKREQTYVRKRFEELVLRELCVEGDPSNPECYEKVETDESPKKRKRKSSYLSAYEDEFRTEGSERQFYEDNKSEFKRLKKGVPSAPKGLVRIAIETGLPLDALKEVYDIGRGAYASSGSRTGMSSEQWGYGRVYAFIMSYFSEDHASYANKRFRKNNTDFHIYEQILEEI